MVIPFPLGTDQCQIEFLSDHGYRYIEAVDFFRHAVAVSYGIRGGLKQHCAIFGCIFRQTRIEVQDLLGT